MPSNQTSAIVDVSFGDVYGSQMWQLQSIDLVMTAGTGVPVVDKKMP